MKREKRSLDDLIAYVHGIPDRVQRLLEADTSADDGRIHQWIRESLETRVRAVKFYQDRWSHTYGCLAHYTTLKNAVAILNQNEPVMRMYNYEVANDPMEGRIRPKEWSDVRRTADWLEEFDIMDRDANAHTCNTYGYSFSSGMGKDDDLTLWRLYGNDGAGCSLMMMHPTPEMYKIRYRRQDGRGREAAEEAEDIDVASQMRELLNAGRRTIDKVDRDVSRGVGTAIASAATQVIEGYSHLVKDVAYAEENEWREVLVNPNYGEIEYDTRKAEIRRYVDGPEIKRLLRSGSAVTIGPRVRSSLVARDYVEMMLEEKGIDLPRVNVSKRSYR